MWEDETCFMRTCVWWPISTSKLPLTRSLFSSHKQDTVITFHSDDIIEMKSSWHGALHHMRNPHSGALDFRSQSVLQSYKALFLLLCQRCGGVVQVTWLCLSRYLSRCTWQPVSPTNWSRSCEDWSRAPRLVLEGRQTLSCRSWRTWWRWPLPESRAPRVRWVHTQTGQVAVGPSDPLDPYHTRNLVPASIWHRSSKHLLLFVSKESRHYQTWWELGGGRAGPFCSCVNQLITCQTLISVSITSLNCVIIKLSFCLQVSDIESKIAALNAAGKKKVSLSYPSRIFQFSQ